MKNSSILICLTAVLGLSAASPSPAASKTIYAGIMGAFTVTQVFDSATRNIQTWDDPNELLFYIRNNVPACAEHVCSNANLDDIRAIAASDPAGGVGALAFYLSGGDAKISLNTPGNSEVVKNFVDLNYVAGDRVIAVGFSAGGGDIQNLLMKLDALGIPVDLSGHIDSIEIGEDDATIPANTRLAKGFYQKESKRSFQGEVRLRNVDATQTTVTNQQISGPIGPYATPDGSAPHRNMDNDERVWGALVEAAAAPQILPAIVPLDFPGAASNDPVELLALLEYSDSNDDKRQIRDLLVGHKNSGQVYAAVMDRYRQSAATASKLHYQSILTRLNSAGYIDRVAGEARTTRDEGLFVSLCYNLGNTASNQSLQALLGALSNPLAGKSAQAATAVYLNAKRVLTVDNFFWLQNKLKGNSLTAAQKQLADRLVR